MSITRVGQPVGGGQLWVPCSATDIRRWVMALDYPNPIHWDEEFARQSRFGGTGRAANFTVCMDFAHGVQPACVGRIPGLASDLRRRGMVVLRHRHPARRPADQQRRPDGYKSATPGSPVPPCSRGRHHPYQPARCAGGEGTGHRHRPISRPRPSSAACSSSQLHAHPQMDLRRAQTDREGPFLRLTAANQFGPLHRASRR